MMTKNKPARLFLFARVQFPVTIGKTIQMLVANQRLSVVCLRVVVFWISLPDTRKPVFDEAVLLHRTQGMFMERCMRSSPPMATIGLDRSLSYIPVFGIWVSATSA